jgi:hypothetical protein
LHVRAPIGSTDAGSRFLDGQWRLRQRCDI